MSIFLSYPPPVPAIRNEIFQVIYSRRATRNYLDKKIGRETIDRLIDAGRMAPSAMNRQPYRFIILDDAEEIRRFSGEIAKAAGLLARLAIGVKFHSHGDPIFYHAPVVIFLAGPKKDEWAGLDIGMCAQNMMLAARSIGLDSCPVGFAKLVEKTGVYAELGLKASEQVYLAVIVGHGNDQPAFHGRKKDNAVYLRE